MLRRLTLPVLLLVTTIVAGIEAWRVDRGAAVPIATGEPAGGALVTPLASARRAPEWLQRPTADAALTAALDTVVAQSPPDTCLVVHDGARVLYRRNATLPLTPASTVKLLTAVAAFDVLGRDHTFDTVAVTTGPARSGIVDGNLYVVGGGDPLLTTQAYNARYDQPQPFTDVALLAERIVAAGVTEIRGDVVGDESRYDTIRSVPSWDPSFLASREAGPLGALLVNDGFVAYPRTRFNTPSTPSANPAEHAAGQLLEALVKKGVRVSGGARSGSAGTTRTEVAKVSTKIDDVVLQMLAHSDNTTAELLTKELGRARSGVGSTAAGVVAAREALAAAGLPVEGVAVVDGSGLDRSNKLTCDFLVALLDRAGPTSIIAASLAVGGRTGTLIDRFVGSAASGALRAKTGSLRNTRSLAGYVDGAATGTTRTLSFAYIANQANLGADANLKVQDQMGAQLAAYPKAPSLEQLGPASVRR
jgi:D-alanyl-D-alanine carboxypeptidase/D-alanyl-D-alanine-endopeptidase (penicillin-binding protein 4)